MRSGATRLGTLGAWDAAAAAANLGKPKQPGEYYGEDALPRSASSGPVFQRACEIRQDGMRGRCDEAWGVMQQAPAPAAAYPDYLGVDRKIAQMISQITTCAIPYNTPMPASWRLSPPPGSAPADVASAWESYSLRSNEELAQARADAAVFCRAGTNNAGVSDGGDPTTGSPTDSGTPQSAIIPGGDVYGQIEGGAVYTPALDPFTAAQRGHYGTVVANPFAPPPPATTATPRRSRTGTALVVVAIGGAALLLLRKRKRVATRYA